MTNIIDIDIISLAVGYLLLIAPMAIILLKRVPMFSDAVMAIIRMTVQLIFVGFYLQVVFDLNKPWLNLAWVILMVLVADVSIIRGCRLTIRKFALPLFCALTVGTIAPVLVFTIPILRLQNWMDAQYVIPLAGMVLGNCLRADIVGLKDFYESIIKNEKAYFQSLVQGADQQEALAPYFRDAVQAALLPTTASMATIGLVALPGMMTGVILAGASPATAIKYQIAIMIAIFSGTAITVFLAVRLSIPHSFNKYGILDRKVFATPPGTRE